MFLYQFEPEYLIKFAILRDLKTVIQINGYVVWAILIIILLLAFYLIYKKRSSTKLGDFEINEAEFGLGEQKLKLRPNIMDLQIAYKIWVELSTRKVGLKIDLEHDVISEVYDSWYEFFSVTRELIKEVPVSKFRRSDTEKIIRLSIEVLNTGIRPHLTQWQARFRRWYTMAINDKRNEPKSPQTIQKEFPEYEKLKEDLLLVNIRLINYRQKMFELISGKKE